MGERASNKHYTGVNFAPKSGENQKQSPSVAIFSQPNLNDDQKKIRSSLQLVQFLPA